MRASLDRFNVRWDAGWKGHCSGEQGDGNNLI